MRTVTFLLIGAVLAPTGLRGQDPGDAPHRSVSIVLGMGAALNGPASGLVDQLREAGYDERSPCFIFCSGSTSHPTEAPPEVAVSVAAHLRVSRPLIVAGGLSRAALGGSTGYRQEGFDWIFSHWSTSTAWVGAFWSAYPGVRVGGGPAVFRMSDDGIDEKHEVSKLGLMGEAGVEYPSNRRFFVDLAVRIHAVPSEDVVYTSRASGNVVTLRPNWTHVQVLVGFGIRLDRKSDKSGR